MTARDPLCWYCYDTMEDCTDMDTWRISEPFIAEHLYVAIPRVCRVCRVAIRQGDLIVQMVRMPVSHIAHAGCIA